MRGDKSPNPPSGSAPGVNKVSSSVLVILFLMSVGNVPFLSNALRRDARLLYQARIQGGGGGGGGCTCTPFNIHICRKIMVLSENHDFVGKS